MSVQHKINLSSADWMIYSTLICFCYLTDFHQLSSFGSRLEGGKNSRFFFCTHISVIAAIMVTGHCLKSIFSILCH